MRRWLPFLLIFLIAAALRLVALSNVPPGLQHDEVFHGHDAVTVLLGYHPLYFTSNAGNEPLFVYLMAATVGLLGNNEWGIRLAAVICGLLALLFTYLWIRRAYHNRTALIASALMAVSFWPLFLSRVGLRAASVPMMAALTAFLISDSRLWIEPTSDAARPMTLRRAIAPSVLAGIALGLSLYTYPAARILPVVVFLFFVSCSLLARQLSRPLLITLITALIVFAPLGYVIVTQPQADVRLQQLGGPVQELLQGNAEPVLRYARDTLGMFNFAGDPIARYNLPGRPVFDVITGILFLLGLWLALRRWREPRNLFALIWLPVGLLPSMLSDSAPSFLRASAALPVVFLFPALALDWAIDRAGTRPRGKTVALALTTVLIIFTGALTIRDYFFVWPSRPDVREVYRTDLAAAAKWIEQQPSGRPIVVASTNPRDLDPFLFDFQLTGDHDVRWIDRAFGMVFPNQPARLISPAYSPIDPKLRERFLPQPSYISRFEDGSTAFEVYDLAPAALPVDASHMITTATTGKGTLGAPIDLGHSLEFLGYEFPAAARPGEGVPLTLYWRVKQDVHGQQLPLSLFVHLLDEHGDLAVGRDLLAFPTASWREGDVWIQQNDLPLPPDFAPGQYRLEIGAYSQADGSRWRVYDAAGNDAGDRLLLAEIEIK